MNVISDAGLAAKLKHLAEFRYQMRKFLSFSETASERCGIGAQQYQLMQVIAAIPEGHQPSISYLAERMVLRHNSTVELVDRAERSGLVRREHDQRDLRRSLVQLTPAGTDLLSKLVLEHLGELAPNSDILIEALHNLRQANESADSPDDLTNSPVHRQPSTAQPAESTPVMAGK